VVTVCTLPDGTRIVAPEPRPGIMGTITGPFTYVPPQQEEQ
jgi:hypothetical protein